MLEFALGQLVAFSAPCIVFSMLFSMFTLMIPNSPFGNFLDFHKNWLDQFGFFSNSPIELVIGLKLLLSIHIGYSLLHGGYYSTNLIQMVLVYVFYTRKRIKQLQSKSYSDGCKHLAYKKLQIINIGINDATGTVLWFYYFFAVGFMVLATFVLIKYKLNLMMINILFNLDIIQATTIQVYMQSAVYMAKDSKQVIESSNSKAFRSLYPLKIWIGKSLPAEDSNLILKIFGCYVFENVINLLITF